jgi:hypothetical protein
MFNQEALDKIVRNGGIPYKSNSVSFVFDCPRCQKHSKLWMYRSTGFFQCWVCAADGFKGPCEKALVELYGGNLKDYQKILRDGGAETLGIINVNLDDDDDDLVVDDSERRFVGWEWSPSAVEFGDPLFERARIYLSSRGIDEVIIKKYGIRYLPGENRVLFPYVIDGELVGWQGRICGPNIIVDSLTGRVREIPKALTKIQDGIQSNYVMCSENLTRSPHAVIAEGPISCYKAELCGGNVCTLGKGVSKSQLKWITDRVKKVYLALDPDASTDISRIANYLTSQGIEVYLMLVPEHVTLRLEESGKKADFGDCTFEEVHYSFLRAKEWNPGQIVISVGSRLCL